jgi:hypothetical protein
VKVSRFEKIKCEVRNKSAESRIAKRFRKKDSQSLYGRAEGTGKALVASGYVERIADLIGLGSTPRLER